MSGTHPPRPRPVRELVREFLPLNRRRRAQDHPLGGAEAARWHELRLLLERSLGVIPPPEAEARRSALRLPADFPVRFEAGVAAGTGAAVDLSEGGIRLRTAASLVARAPIELDLLPPASAPLRLTGVVRWVGGPGPDGQRLVGIRFENLDPPAEQALVALVEDLLARLSSAAGRAHSGGGR